MIKNDIIRLTISAGVLTSIYKRMEVVTMTVYEALSLTLAFATFILLLITYIKK
jgi:hypothetical protein